MIGTFDAIQQHYKNLSNAISNQLQLETPNHHLTSGTSRELVWLNVFKSIVPKKFKLAQSVFLIDSFGQISAEVDIAIYDEHYTPYIFNYENISFIPIEAVVVAVQSKSRTMDKETMLNVTDWVERIYQLKPALNAYVRIQPDLLDTGNLDGMRKQTQTATRPILILCTLNSLKTNVHNKDISVLSDLKQNFDFILHLDKNENFNLKIIVDNNKSLVDWYKELNHYKLERYKISEEKLKGIFVKGNATVRTLKDNVVEGNTLLTFKMQLNQLLMLINNPMFFPHASYVDMFNEVIKLESEKEGSDNEQV